MTPREFEIETCNIFFENGFWALRIPKDERGAQPFDVLAIRGSEIYAFDCKVCSTPRLQLTRAEDNQLASMSLLKRRTTAYTGFLAWHEGEIYLIPFRDVEEAIKAGKASIKLVRRYADKWQHLICSGIET